MKKMLEAMLAPIDENAEKTALALSEKFGDIYKLAAATDDAILDAVDGKMTTLVYIRMCYILASRRITDSFKLGKPHTESEIKEYCKALFILRPVETLYVMSEDKDGRIIAVDHAGEGTVSLSGLLPRRLLDIAARRKAKRIIIAHNHPRGYSDPSEDDIRSTDHLRGVLFSAGIELVGHYVVAGADCTAI